MDDIEEATGDRPDMPSPATGRKPFFARAEEIVAIVDDLRKSEQLWIVALDAAAPPRVHLVGPAEPLALHAGIRLYVCADTPPAEYEGRSSNELNPMAEGWVQLDVGNEDDVALEMSVLAFKSEQASAAKLRRGRRWHPALGGRVRFEPDVPGTAASAR